MKRSVLTAIWRRCTSSMSRLESAKLAIFHSLTIYMYSCRPLRASAGSMSIQNTLKLRRARYASIRLEMLRYGSMPIFPSTILPVIDTLTSRIMDNKAWSIPSSPLSPAIPIQRPSHRLHSSICGSMKGILRSKERKREEIRRS